jgi:hypothetical protein
MGNNGVPFGGNGRPINPRFSLNNEPEGVETEEFSPKKNVGSFPPREKRSAPQPFSGSGNSAPVFIPTGVSERRVSPNSLFSGGDDDGLSLDVGVNETDTSPTPVVHSSDVSREKVQVAAAVSTPRNNEPKRFSPLGGFDNEEELSLDVGVNETDPDPITVSEPVVSVVSRPVAPRIPVVAEPIVAPVIETEVTSESEEEELSLDVGVDETDEPDIVKSDDIVIPVTPKVTPVSVPPRPRMVNPMFADPSTEKEEEELSLDVGVNETEDAPAKRVVSPLFDFKSDGFAPTHRKPDVRRLRPDSMIDTGSVEDFDEDKKAAKAAKNAKKAVEPTRRPFQIQERDITLLRFLTKYQFSYVDALARVVDSTPQSITKRLRTLEDYDLVKRQTIAAGSTLWQSRKAGIELSGMAFKENKRSISFATIRHTIGLINLAAELEREAPGSKDILGLGDKFGEEFPAMNRFPGGIRLYGEEALETSLTYGEMTVSEREIRQGQKRYRGGRSSADMRDIVDFAILNPEAPELEPGNEGLFVVYGHGGKTGEHVPDLVVTRPRDENGKPQHFAIELELTPKSPADWKRILRSYRENGGMYSRIYYFTADRPIANMIRNADEEVGLGERLVLRKYTPKNKRQPFLG